MIEKVGASVIGAGVVGLACARQLALGGIETVILEAHGAIGTEISSRNSEVIHAGIYYPPASLKASLCVRGRHALYEYCEARGITTGRCGKLIVATSEAQLPALEELRARALAHGVLDLSLLTAAQARAIEPELHCHRAKRFYGEVRQYWPGLPDESLAPAYCGIRPKLAGPGQAAADFLIQGPADHGVPGLVNLFGIESPGLTSCLAIGEHVARTLNLARAR